MQKELDQQEKTVNIMLFLELYNLLLENNFSSLPENIPYGFWIEPSGDFEVVARVMGHGQIAEKIVKESEQLRDAYQQKLRNSSYTGEVTFLQSLGYMRCVRGNHSGSPALFYEKTLVEFTRRQMSTLKDISNFYQVKPVLDNPYEV